MSISDKVDNKDLKQMVIGSLAVIGAYLLKLETTIMQNINILVMVTGILLASRFLFRHSRDLPVSASATSHVFMGFLVALLVSWLIGGIVLGFEFNVILQVAVGVLPATLLMDALGGP